MVSVRFPCLSPVQGWGLLSRFPPFRYFPDLSTSPKYMLAIEYLAGVAQLNCGDTCEIWMRFKECNRYFCEITNFAYGEIDERSFSNPHPMIFIKLFRRLGNIVLDSLGRIINHVHCLCHLYSHWFSSLFYSQRLNDDIDLGQSCPMQWLVAWHYLSEMASQITSVSIVCSTIYSFIRAQIKENIKASRHWPLCREFTGHRWIPRTKGQ